MQLDREAVHAINDHKLNLDEQGLNELYNVVNNARQGSKMVKVSKDDLWNLLQDHITLINELKG